MQNRANPPAAGSQAAASSLSDPVVASSDSESDLDLASQRDEAYQRMLEAVDALRGAQAEQAAAKARVAELEHQVHVYVAENEHLHSLVKGRGDVGIRRRLGTLARSAKAATSSRPADPR